MSFCLNRLTPSRPEACLLWLIGGIRMKTPRFPVEPGCPSSEDLPNAIHIGICGVDAGERPPAISRIGYPPRRPGLLSVRSD